MSDPKPKSQKPVRYMDFVSHKPKANADPLASRPVARPVAKPAPVKKVHSVADQIPAHHNPVEKHPERAPKIETSGPVAVKKREEKPYISRTPASSRDLYADAIDPNKSASKPVIKDDLALKASAALSGAAKQPAPKAPDNNAYSLGGKSPFLENYVINKRPLSDSVPTKKKDNFEKLSFLGVSDQEPTHHKNVYQKSESTSSAPEKSDKASKSKKTKTVRVIDDTKKKRGVPTWLVILITIILGAAVGTGVYFLLPK